VRPAAAFRKVTPAALPAASVTSETPVRGEGGQFFVLAGGSVLHARSQDSEILERARAEDRIVITADLDYPRLLALLKADRPGVILFRGGGSRCEPPTRSTTCSAASARCRSASSAGAAVA
jgi:hypothetical protein